MRHILTKWVMAPRWYRPAHISTTVRLQQVTLADLMLYDELEGSWLLNTCNKMEATCKGAQKVSKHDHRRLLHEISRMEILEFDEDEDDIMDCSGSRGWSSPWMIRLRVFGVMLDTIM
jgi:hypothetical protein